MPTEVTLEFVSSRLEQIQVKNEVETKPQPVPKSGNRSGYLAFAHCFVSYVLWGVTEEGKAPREFWYEGKVKESIASSLAAAIENPTWIADLFGEPDYKDVFNGVNRSGANKNSPQTVIITRKTLPPNSVFISVDGKIVGKAEKLEKLKADLEKQWQESKSTSRKRILKTTLAPVVEPPPYTAPSPVLDSPPSISTTAPPVDAAFKPVANSASAPVLEPAPAFIEQQTSEPVVSRATVPDHMSAASLVKPALQSVVNSATAPVQDPAPSLIQDQTKNGNVEHLLDSPFPDPQSNIRTQQHQVAKNAVRSDDSKKWRRVSWISALILLADLIAFRYYWINPTAWLPTQSVYKSVPTGETLVHYNADERFRPLYEAGFLTIFVVCLIFLITSLRRKGSSLQEVETPRPPDLKI